MDRKEKTKAKAKKILDGLQKKQLAWGTGLTGMETIAPQILMNSAFQGIDTIAGGGRSYNNTLNNWREGGQMFADGGVVTGTGGVKMTQNYGSLPTDNNNDPYWKSHPFLTQHDPMVEDSTPWGYKPHLLGLPEQAFNPQAGIRVNPQYPQQVPPVVPSDKALGKSNTYYSGRSQPQAKTPDAIESTSGNYAMGTGGSGIHIKASHKGRFTAWAKKHGMSVSEAASHVMANKGGYSGSVVKMANFAKNFAANGTNASGLPPFVDPSQMQQPQANVEVEGNEVAQTPGGQTMQFNGPSHEQGGIDATLPVGTKVYSDRLSVDGKTMQQRKLSRERQLGKMTKLLDNNQTDTITRNSYNRTKAALDMEEQSDLAMQDAANKAYQTGLNVMQPTGDQIQAYQRSRGIPQTDPDEGGDSMQQFAYGTSDDDILSPGAYDNLLGIPGNVPQGKGMGLLPSTSTDPSVTAHNYSLPSAYVDQKSTAMPFSTGDKLGFLGSAEGSVLPLATTIANRAGDRPNVNQYKNFGNNALASNDQAMGFVGQQRDKNIIDMNNQIAAQRIRNRNSATGVSTSRALDLATTGQAETSLNGIYGNFAQQMAGEYNERSKLNNQQDLYQGMGQGQADKADRMDRDAYYSNLGSNFGNISTKTETLGKNLNQNKYNSDVLAIMPELSKYGLGFEYDENGKPVLTKMQ